MARILHIEDDPKNRLLVRKLLTPHGHEVVDAETGLAGVQLAQTCSPDLVLVDINVPDLDGYEVTLRLRGTPALHGVPIVAITAEGDRETSLAVGADGFIGKPIDATRFPKTIARFLEGFRERGDQSEERLRDRSQRIVARLEDKVVALQQANERLEWMAKLRREFLQNMSHELATPLTPVVGYLQLLLNDELGELSPLQKKCLGQVMSSTQRLRALIDTLLDVSALETGRMTFRDKPYDFLEIVREALGQIRPAAQARGIRITEELPPRAMPAHGDPERLERAIVHVLENSVKFSPDGGEVAVQIDSPTGTTYACVVADSGPGVAEHEIKRIFEPFYQVDGSVTRSHGGVGLGLAFVRRVAEAHGGAVTVSSPPRGPVAGRTLRGTEVVVTVAPQRPVATP